MTRKEMVLRTLIEGPKTNWELQSVEIGSVSGLRRLRELRKDGHKIEKKRLLKDGKATGTFVYQLIEDEKNT